MQPRTPYAKLADLGLKPAEVYALSTDVAPAHETMRATDAFTIMREYEFDALRALMEEA